MTLVKALLRNHVRPYFLHLSDLSEGLAHSRTPAAKGIGIIEHLIGPTCGFTGPTNVVVPPRGGSTIPPMPNYLISWGTDRVELWNYAGDLLLQGAWLVRPVLV